MCGKYKLIIALIVIFLASCSSSLPAPTETPLPTNTFEPTEVHSPTATLEPILPPELPTGTPDKSGQGGFDLPLTSWNGIPVMKGVITGSGDNNSYRFIINEAASKVNSYYSLAMQNMGWKLVSTGNQNGTVVLVYTKGAETVKISITQQASFTVVILAKGP